MVTLKKHATYLVLLPLVATISGCLYELTLDDKGGGTMTAQFQVSKPDLQTIKGRMGSSAVKVTSAELVTKEGRSEGVFKLQFSDVTKLSTVEQFRGIQITRVEGPKGMVLSAKIRHDKPLNLPDAVVDRFGKEVRVIVNLPGDVVESNGKVSGGKTVTWSWGIREFFDAPEVVMTATYKQPGAAAEATKAPAESADKATSPTASAAQTPTAAAGKGKSSKSKSKPAK
jgi:hypothetical protein